jgi:hypothetical protein
VRGLEDRDAFLVTPSSSLKKSFGPTFALDKFSILFAIAIDYSIDVYFLTENREILLDAVRSILAGNPFVYLKKLTDLNLEEYFTEITEKNHPFSLLASANAYMASIRFYIK